jgi:hypothetical protein
MAPMRLVSSRALMVVYLSLASAVGCGLISSDVTRVSFDLPTKTYTFDTSSWMLPNTGTVPAVPCATTADCCALPGINCATAPLTCDGTMCALHYPVHVVQTMDLGQEVPQLHGAQSLANITISQITYTVTSTLNVDLPELTLYLAPGSITDPTDPSAALFGTVPATPAGATKNGQVALDPNAQQAFAGYAKNLDTPFNFIATTTVVVGAGMPIPSGQVIVSVTGRVSVQAL